MIRRFLAAVAATVILTATPLAVPVSAQNGPYGDCIVIDIICIPGEGDEGAQCTIFMICF